MAFQEWLKTFVDETDKIDEEYKFYVNYKAKGEIGQMTIKMKEVILFLNNADEIIQEKVKNDVVFMDLTNKNSDFFKMYFTQVATGMANVYTKDYERC